MFNFIAAHTSLLITACLGTLHFLGICAALEALYFSKNSQSAIAWCLSLIVFPYGALPTYLILGRTRFRGYTKLIQQYLTNSHVEYVEVLTRYKSFFASSVPISLETETALEKIAGSEFVGGNSVSLLVNGEATFKAIIAECAEAQQYILVQFYIIRSDALGVELSDALIASAKRGVKVKVLYDEMGSAKLAKDYISKLREAGVEIAPFGTRQGGWRNFFQLNFRNHRKIVVVDGKVAFVGGHNVGDEYLGKCAKFGAWRDTHVRIEGPAVFAIQGSFLDDWYWGTRETLKLDWSEPNSPASVRVLPIATGPADDKSRCSLMFVSAIASAKKRCWIASPYFVPDDSILAALQLAALRGVDVRVILPSKPDHMLVWLASFSFIPEITKYGVKVLRYQSGFLHQKVALFDDSLSFVGTANLDQRSFRLNFEITIAIADKDFASQIEAMLTNDLSCCKEERVKTFSDLSIGMRLAGKFARLFSPIL